MDLEQRTYLWANVSHGDPFLFRESGLAGSVELSPRPLMLSYFAPIHERETRIRNLTGGAAYNQVMNDSYTGIPESTNPVTTE